MSQRVLGTIHKHLKIEEVYYIVKGKAKIRIGENILVVEPGNILPTHKDTYHGIQSVEIPVELVLVTYPKYDKNDIIF